MPPKPNWVKRMISHVCLPPSVAITGYLFWYQGQQIILSSHYNRSYHCRRWDTKSNINKLRDWFNNTWWCILYPEFGFSIDWRGYICWKGVKITCFEYASQRSFSRYKKNIYSKNVNNNHKQFTVYNNNNDNSKREGIPARYKPPKNMLELAKRVAPPITLRIAASSVAFFCAGCVQTYIALK